MSSEGITKVQALIALIAIISSVTVGYFAALPSAPTTPTYRKNGCTGTGNVKFGSPPMKIDDIGLIVPMGAMIGGHVTPIDHQYYQPADFKSLPDTYDVMAIGDGVIVSIGLEGKPVESNGPGYNKYRLVIMHTCTFYSIYNLLTSLSPRITAVTGEIKPASTAEVNIPVREGEIIGKIGGQTLDLSVNDDNVILKGFIMPEHYQSEPWKIHTVDPFDYFKEPVRSQLLAKNIREVQPLGGKIDYDIDGRLVGNWFKENTNGYGAVERQRYWSTHLAIVYDHVDPTQIRVSLGDFNGSATQFGVKGNSPDPANVTVSTGLVKYDLVQFDYYLGDTGQGWDRFTYAKGLKSRNIGNTIFGVVLLQLIQDRKLKVEIFLGKTSSDVIGFSDAAMIYER